MNKILLLSSLIVFVYNNLESCEEYSQKPSDYFQITKARENAEAGTESSNPDNSENIKKIATDLKKKRDINLDNPNNTENFLKNRKVNGYDDETNQNVEFDKDMNWNKLMTLSCSVK